MTERRRPRSFVARDSRQIVFGSIEEEVHLRHVLKLIRFAGGCALHVRYSQGVLQGAHGPRSSDHDDASGWPDLVIVRPGKEILYRELKREGKEADGAQRRWGGLITSAGGNWDVWKPSDENRILRELGL
jgi:hypothetical protein